MSEETNVRVLNGSEMLDVTLDQMAGIDLTNVEAYRGGEKTPEGLYEWRIKQTVQERKEIMDNSLTPPAKVPRPCIMLSLEVIAARQLKDPSINPADLVGFEHTEMISIKDLQRDIGRYVAFLEDIGFQGRGKLADMMAQTTGWEFVAPMKHTVNKNDTSKVYANLDFSNVLPLNPPAPAQQAVAANVQQGAIAPATAPAQPVQAAPAAAPTGGISI